MTTSNGEKIINPALGNTRVFLAKQMTDLHRKCSCRLRGRYLRQVFALWARLLQKRYYGMYMAGYRSLR